MVYKFLMGAVGACLFLTSFIGNAAPVALEVRLGGSAYYDPNLDITWATNADIDGAKSWDEANTWAASLDIGGVTGWRLPDMDVNNDGTIVSCGFAGETECKDNEMGYLFHVEGIKVSAQSPFNSIQGGRYWSNTDAASPPYPANYAWNFLFDVGNQSVSTKIGTLNVWAVHSGDVGIVPVPAAVWLFGSGLIGLIGVARSKKS